jgi:hypothetical protein
MDHHDIERIAVIGLRRWNEPPVMRIGQAGEERLGERERFELGVVGEFRAAAARRFDDDMYVPRFSEGRQVDEIGHDGPL